METLNLTKDQKNKVIGEFLDSINDWRSCFKLTQFVLMKLSEEAINMNAGELALSQSMDHNGELYTTRMSIQYSKHGEQKSLEERASELADRMLSTGSANCDIREELKKAILAGYNLHHEDFDDDESEDD
jgi:hypothetical protein